MGTGPKLKLPVINPYVGPRPFTRDESTRFFGRDNESRDLLSLAVSEQLVLFYAQSGAGKSSLVNTRLVPGLEERQFEVLPIGRVSGDTLKNEQCDNIFVFNLLANLDQSKTSPERFAHMQLGDFLANLYFTGEKFLYASEPVAEAPVDESAPEILPRALVIDQFEEIITTHPEAWEKRGDFFAQLAEAMEQDPYLWVVLVMREDYVAALDPFAHLLPNQLRARFYMRRMGNEAALDAVRKPVEKMRPFDTGIAETLVDNLRLVSGTQPQGGKSEPVYGEFIEPVQLQVVCYQLWSNLMNEVDTLAPGKRITQTDIDSLAKGANLAQFINTALADFYEQALAKVLEKMPGKVTEAELRKWFSTELITESETRGFVFQGKTHTAGLPNEAVNILASQYIIRPETRPGGTWFEIVHDRFIGPILQANRSAESQSLLRRRALEWDSKKRSQAYMLRGEELREAQAEIDKNPGVISELEKEFVKTSAKEDAKTRQRIVAGAFAALVLLVTVLVFFSFQAVQGRNKAMAAESAAKVAKEVAEDARVTAENARVTAESAKNAAENARTTAESAKNAALTAQAELLSKNATAEFQTTALVDQANRQREGLSRLQEQINGLLLTVAVTPQVESTATPVSNTPTNASSLPTPPGKLTPTSQSGNVFTAIPSPVPTSTPVPTATVAELPYRDIVIGQSVKGNDIIVHQFGSGPRHIILVGGLHAGYAPSTTKITKQLYEYFSNNPADVPTAFTLDIVYNANPDILTGLDLSSQVKGRLNANGVDLNRNWDCYWRRDATWSAAKLPVDGGIGAFSEPESEALRKFILKNVSVAVVSFEAHELLGQSTEPGGCGEVSLFSQPLSDLYAKAARYNSITYVPYGTTGAMVDWVDSQGIPAITVYLPNLTTVGEEFTGQIRAVLALLASYNVEAK